MKSTTYVVLALLLASAGCARRPARPGLNLTTGDLARAEWRDCKVNLRTGRVHCACQDFDVAIKKDGTAVITCRGGN